MKDLPKGVKLDHGYVQVRLMYQGQIYCKNFGKDCELARELAAIHLHEKRKEILMGKFGVVPKIPRKKFDEVVKIYYALWSNEIRPDGTLRHTDQGKKNVRTALRNSLIPFFGKQFFDAIKPGLVQKWREERLRKIQGTSANREQAVLSSIFSHVEEWTALEKIKKFQAPEKNPCRHIERAATVKRKRLLTTAELSRLKEACILHNDLDLWEIVKVALKSLLRSTDLRDLEAGQIDIVQNKTQRDLRLPVTVLRALNYSNFRRRWKTVRHAAGLDDVQFRDLRKTGANLLKLKNYSNKLISEYLGHANTATTELYMVKDVAHLKPLADDLGAIVDAL